MLSYCLNLTDKPMSLPATDTHCIRTTKFKRHEFIAKYYINKAINLYL